MKLSTLFSVIILTAFSMSGQNLSELDGAWGRQHQGNQQTLVFANGFWSFTEFNIETKDFIGTMGGSYADKSPGLSYIEEYHTFTENQQRSNPLEGSIKLKSKTLKIGDQQWKRIDDGSPGDLNGAWLITGGERNGQMSTITPGARKTMKILSGTRFQWIAYNSETMQFMGTGGGTYSTKDGKYIENIEFFSRDSSRVGASLDFNYEIRDKAWHHSGKSSKGNPIYEIWSLRK